MLWGENLQGAHTSPHFFINIKLLSIMGSSWSTEFLSHGTEIFLSLCGVPSPEIPWASGWSCFAPEGKVASNSVTAPGASFRLPPQPPALRQHGDHWRHDLLHP